jgi:hypothetical protein
VKKLLLRMTLAALALSLKIMKLLLLRAQRCHRR